jgi:hypothetical protein
MVCLVSGPARSMPGRRCRIRCSACARATAGHAAPARSSKPSGPARLRPAAAARAAADRPEGALRGQHVQRGHHLRPPAADHRIPPPGRQRRLGRGSEQHQVLAFDQGPRSDIDQPRAIPGDRQEVRMWSRCPAVVSARSRNVCDITSVTPPAKSSASRNRRSSRHSPAGGHYAAAAPAGLPPGLPARTARQLPPRRFGDLVHVGAVSYAGQAGRDQRRC